MALPGDERLVYGVIAMIPCAIELIIFFSKAPRPRYRNLAFSWVSFTIGMMFLHLDSDPLLCDPSNHVLTPHGVWHWLTALATFFMARYISQFPGLKRLRHSKG